MYADSLESLLWSFDSKHIKKELASLTISASLGVIRMGSLIVISVLITLNRGELFTKCTNLTFVFQRMVSGIKGKDKKMARGTVRVPGSY